MKIYTKKTVFVLIFSVCFLSVYSQSEEQRRRITSNYDLRALKEMQTRFSNEFAENYARALELARINNWPVKIDKEDGGVSELQGVFEDGTPIYYTTVNRGSAISSRTNKIQPGGSLGLNLTGLGMFVGEWDGGLPREDHLDLLNRIYPTDNAVDVTFHATHVAGTMISSGVHNSSGRGMAYEADLWANDWTNDLSEMTDAASNAMLLSNHSYGLDVNSNTPLNLYGAYINQSKGLDDLVFSAPYYQPVIAAGNDRTSGINTDKFGYDLLTKHGTSKNAIIVGAVNEVPNYVNASNVQMSAFSNWGPTDDNRIKPDICTKGVHVLSTSDISTTAYAYTDGTSMACPGVTGSLLLWQKHYSNLNEGNFMLAATLRALMIHTADEAGESDGPDVQFGWGLLNSERAAQTITNATTGKAIISELNLKQGTVFTKQVTASGTEPLLATIDWTDRGGRPNNTTVDLATPVLVNNLDIKITKNTDTYYPWKLGADYGAPAERGENNVDNVEKIEVKNPSGVYTITVTNKGLLVGGNQNFSLVVTGIDENLSVNETAFDVFDVWPNPVSNKLNVSVKSQLLDEVFVTMFDVQGKELLNEKLGYENTFFNGILNTESLSSGIYFVKVIQGDTQSIRKIVKN